MITSKLSSASVLSRFHLCSSSVRCASKYEPQKYDVPQLNKGRLDWLFGDGWRRPLPIDQGGKMRKDWICFGYHPTDEYTDWKVSHRNCFIVFFLVPTMLYIAWYYKVDTYKYDEWARREAYFEIERRQKAGLPLISKDLVDPNKIQATLPSEEELGSFRIII